MTTNFELLAAFEFPFIMLCCHMMSNPYTKKKEAHGHDLPGCACFYCLSSRPFINVSVEWVGKRALIMTILYIHIFSVIR